LEIELTAAANDGFALRRCPKPARARCRTLLSSQRASVTPKPTRRRGSASDKGDVEQMSEKQEAGIAPLRSAMPIGSHAAIKLMSAEFQASIKMILRKVIFAFQRRGAAGNRI
jgi:hypothetical protein